MVGALDIVFSKKSPHAFRPPALCAIYCLGQTNLGRNDGKGPCSMCTSNNLKLNSRLSLSINHLDRMIGNPSGIGPSHRSIIIKLVVTVVEFAEDKAKIRVEANHS